MKGRQIFSFLAVMTCVFAGCSKEAGATTTWKCPECGCGEDSGCGCAPGQECKCKDHKCQCN